MSIFSKEFMDAVEALERKHKSGNFRKGDCTPHAGKQKKDHPWKRRIYPIRKSQAIKLLEEV